MRDVARSIRAEFRGSLGRFRLDADFTVPGLTFVDGGKDAKGPTLQPSDLSEMAKGVIANADGTIKGNGRIDWTPKGVTATGAFGSDDLDAFGDFINAVVSFVLVSTAVYFFVVTPVNLMMARLRSGEPSPDPTTIPTSGWRRSTGPTRWPGSRRARRATSPSSPPF